jgi:glycosyltransferase involved in cell wall biosynthesis
MKRIAIVAHGLDNGGAERVAALLANGLLSYGNQVLYIAAHSQKREYSLESKIEYVYIRAWGGSRLLRYISKSVKIDKAIRISKVDIIISFITRELIIYGSRKTVPIIYSLRNDPSHVTRKIFDRNLLYYLYNRAYRIVFQTQGACDFFPEKIKNKGIVIGNPLTAGLPYWNFSTHEKTVITACRLEKQKNLKMLIKSFCDFHRIHPEYRLKIYGRGELLLDLIEYTRELSIVNYVDFPGYRKDIHEIIAHSGIFVLTSDYEGLSNSMLEAMAIGIPLICTKCPPGGPEEYIENGVNGMLINIRDCDALTSKLLILAEDTALCQKMHMEEIKIRSKLEKDAIVKKWIELIDI